jgi:hypothetical protein
MGDHDILSTDNVDNPIGSLEPRLNGIALWLSFFEAGVSSWGCIATRGCKLSHLSASASADGLEHVNQTCRCFPA